MRTDLWLKLFRKSQSLATCRRARRPHARAAIERFENRTLLAGVVSMEINGDGNLVITGDDSGNEFTVTQAGDTFTISDPGDFAFDTGGPTLFDVGAGPVAGPVSVTGTVNDVEISVGGSNDFVTILFFDVGNIDVDGGTGHNQFLMRLSIANGDVTVENGDGGFYSQTVVDGDETVITEGFFGGETDFETSLILGSLSITNGAGFDDAKIDFTAIFGDVEINNGDGGSYLREETALDGADVEKYELLTGFFSSFTDIEAESVIGGDVSIENGDGYDEVGVEESLIQGGLEISNGDGGAFSERVFELDEEDERLSGFFGGRTSISKGSFVGHSVDVDNDYGFDQFDLEDSTLASTLNLDNGNGGTRTKEFRDAEEFVLDPTDWEIDETGFWSSTTDIETSDDEATFATSVGGSVNVKNGNGFDAFDMQNTSVGRDVEIKNGSGDSTVLLETRVQDFGEVIIGDDLLIENGDGSHSVELLGILVDDDVTIKNGDGGSETLIEFTGVGGDLEIETGDGADVIEIGFFAIEGETDISTGGDDDFVGIALSLFGDDVTLDGGAGLGDELDVFLTGFLGDFDFENFEIV